MFKKLDPKAQKKLVDFGIYAGIVGIAGIGAYCLIKGGMKAQKMVDNDVMDRLISNDFIKLTTPDGKTFEYTKEAFSEWTKAIEATDLNLVWHLPN